MTAPTPLIAVAELAQLRLSDRPPVVLDVRWRLDEPDGLPAFRESHLPDAVYVSLDDELARHGDPGEGRHPLPDPGAFQASARRWGIDDGDTVVVYDDWQGFGSARAWWMLTDAGVDARVLDGGLAAWRSAGLPLSTGDPHTPEPGDVTPHPGHLRQLGIDEAAALAQSGVLLDVRAPERYRGDTEPIDPRAGHIPGARNAPTALNTDSDGRFLHDYALRERFEAAGVDSDTEVGVYCGSGVSAAHAALALTLAGYEPALYVGSWSQWSNHPDRPVATGAQP